MSNEDYPYPEDEFDVLGADRTPQGVHRAPVPRWRQLLPFAVVIVLAPVLAYVGVRALSGGFDDEPAQDPPPAVEETEEPTEEDAEEPTEEETEPEEEETEDPEEEETLDPDLDLSSPVYILNGTATVGIAGSAAEVLTEDGWTNVNTSDYGQALPESTELYYNNSELADEAEAVADALEISDTFENPDAASAGIVIVIRDDFQ